jgi:hypothetical protein
VSGFIITGAGDGVFLRSRFLFAAQAHGFHQSEVEQLDGVMDATSRAEHDVGGLDVAVRKKAQKELQPRPRCSVFFVLSFFRVFVIPLSAKPVNSRGWFAGRGL